MKATRTNLLLLSLILVALACAFSQRPATEAPLCQALEDNALSVEPLSQEEMPRQVEAPTAVEPAKVPVQSLEERGDAMLFESEALLGTPFGHSIVMPFD